FQDEPGPESADVAVGHARTVVELEDGTLVGDRREAEASRHPQVHEETEATLEADEQVLPPPLDRDDGVALELLGDLEEVVRPGEPRIEDLHADERPPFETRRELRPDGLDLRKLRHQ